MKKQKEEEKPVLTKKETAEIMLYALIKKCGLMLNSKQCAIETRATKSTRTLDEDRKKGTGVPSYCADTVPYLYPVQNVVEFHLMKSNNVIQVIN
jgi:hypothetical protein